MPPAPRFTRTPAPPRPQASVQLVGCKIGYNGAVIVGGVVHAGASGGSSSSSSSGGGVGSHSGSNTQEGEDTSALVGAMQLDGSYLHNNRACCGGVLSVGGRLGRLSASNSTLINNTADPLSCRQFVVYGGVVWVNGSVGDLVFERGTSVTGILSTYAALFGEVIGLVLSAQGPVRSIGITDSELSTIADVQLSSPLSWMNELVFSAKSIGNVTIQHSRLAGNIGGVLCVNGDISSVALLNSSIVDGGGKPALSCGGSVGQVVIAQNSSVSRNVAYYGNGAVYGGSFLQVAGDLGSLVLTNRSAVDGNAAIGYASAGGAVLVQGHLGRLEVSGNSSLSGNRARVDGGAVAAGSIGSVVITGGSVVIGNVAGDSSRSGLDAASQAVPAPASGGAIYANMTLDALELSGGARVEGNRATQDGGAVYARLHSAALRRNTAIRGAGGAIASVGMDQNVGSQAAWVAACARVGFPLATCNKRPEEALHVACFSACMSSMQRWAVALRR